MHNKMTKTKYNFNGRTEYIKKDVLDTAPSGGDIKDLRFFKINRYITDNELENEYKLRDLSPATIDVLCEFDKCHRNELDDKKYVGTHWKDADDNVQNVDIISW
jgi:hypothetical protein